MTQNHQKYGLLTLLSILLIAGFLSTSLVGYYVSVSSMREHIVSTELPLTGDTVYSEIQRDLLHPVFISSLMANDTFLKDWMHDGETSTAPITAYLKEIKDKYRTYSSFLVSEKSRHYYYAKGILKTVQIEEPRDEWYFRIKDLESDYEINVDPDMANNDNLTVFVNHKILDADGQYMGAAGVGLTIDSVGTLMERYSAKYGHGIYFVTPAGKIVLRSSTIPQEAATFHELEGLEDRAEAILAKEGASLQVKRRTGLVHLNTRYIPELDWYLVVEQADRPLTEDTFSALIINLILCTIITSIVLWLSTVFINAYHRRINKMFAAERILRQESMDQQAEITKKHEALEAKNAELKDLLREVKTLSGLLPICASCKRIRSEEGYWKQVEVYVSEHTEAEFSHGICPTCMEDLYPNAIQRSTTDP